MPRIFIISPHPVFSQGVETLLGRETDLRVVGRDADVERALTSIKALRPDVILIDDDASLCVQNSALMRLLDEKAGPQVIRLNLHSNTLSIYRTTEYTVNEFSDLVELIKHPVQVPQEVEHPHNASWDSKDVIPQMDNVSKMEDERDEQPN